MDNLVQCCECFHGDFICVSAPLDNNPYEQDWGGICKKEIIKGVIDPFDYGKPRSCDNFIKKED